MTAAPFDCSFACAGLQLYAAVVVADDAEGRVLACALSLCAAAQQDRSVGARLTFVHFARPAIRTYPFRVAMLALQTVLLATLHTRRC